MNPGALLAHSAIGAEAAPSTHRSLRFATVTVGLAAVAAGSAVGLAPLAACLGVCGLVLAVVLLLAMAALPLWQKLAAVALAGFVILNYGFANWALLPGVPIPVGHVLLLTSLALAGWGSGHVLRAFFREPAVIWWMGLGGLSVAHLVLDIPTHGMLAIRDASFVLDGLFLLLGFLWSQRDPRGTSVFAVLAVIFLLNALYALTFPVARAVQALSSVSGLFHGDALLGSYAHTSLFLVAGGLYYFLVARYTVSWPSALVVGLAVFQICWALVFQDRSMYVGIVVALTLLMLLRGVRVGGRIAVVVMASVAFFLVGVGASGVALQGRIGEVGSNFLSQHVRSLLLDPSAPAEGSVEWRLVLLRQLWSRFTVSTQTILLGEGFGDPLIEFKNTAGAVVRQPHNTHITVLLRLGIVGFAFWLGMHQRIIRSLVRFLREGRQEPLSRDLALWFLVLYVLAMLLTTVQPWLEFSHGAVSFYMLMGLALGMSQQARLTRGASEVPERAFRGRRAPAPPEAAVTFLPATDASRGQTPDGRLGGYL